MRHCCIKKSEPKRSSVGFASDEVRVLASTRRYRVSVLTSLIQTRVRENIVGNWFEESRECRRVVGFRTAIDVYWINKSQISLRARCCYVQKATFFFQIVKFILKAIRWKPPISHP